MSERDDEAIDRSTGVWLRRGECFVFAQMAVNNSAVVADTCTAMLAAPVAVEELGNAVLESMARFRNVQTHYDEKKETKAFLKHFGAKSASDLRKNTGHVTVSENSAKARLEVTVWRPNGSWGVPAEEYNNALPIRSTPRDIGNAVWRGLKVSEWLNSPAALEPPEEAKGWA